MQQRLLAVEQLLQGRGNFFSAGLIHQMNQIVQFERLLGRRRHRALAQAMRGFVHIVDLPLLVDSDDCITNRRQGDDGPLSLGSQCFGNLFALTKNSFRPKNNANQESNQQQNLDSDQPPGYPVGCLTHLSGKVFFQRLYGTVDQRDLARQDILHFLTPFCHVAVDDDFLVDRIQLHEAFFRCKPETKGFLKHDGTSDIALQTNRLVNVIRRHAGWQQGFADTLRILWRTYDQLACLAEIALYAQGTLIGIGGIRITRMQVTQQVESGIFLILGPDVFTCAETACAQHKFQTSDTDDGQQHEADGKRPDKVQQRVVFCLHTQNRDQDLPWDATSVPGKRRKQIIGPGADSHRKIRDAPFLQTGMKSPQGEYRKRCRIKTGTNPLSLPNQSGIVRAFANDVAPVAQLDRVLGYEPRGRAFESLRARQSFVKLRCRGQLGGKEGA